MIQEVSRKLHHTALDGLFRYAEFLNFGELHVKFDHATGLRAIVAIHNLKLGSGLGGCRIVHYGTTDKAIEDALRLAYMMSLKAAMSNIPHGGAKAVLIAPKVIKNRRDYFHSFADFVQSLGGRYITAIDSGSSMTDMDIVAERTPYVTCTTKYGNDGDPSFHTANGVLRAIEACVKFKLGQDSLQDVHVAIQGAGHVGYCLAKGLKSAGARITMTDINEVSLARCVEEFGVSVCPPERIYSVEADVFSPCALGATLNLQTIKLLKAPIVAGSANNQLAHHHHCELLKERGILYAPDFVANAGGLIYASAMYDHNNFEVALQQVNGIYQILMDVFERAQIENRATLVVAEAIAMEKLR